ncbi:MAG: DUF167 domain-containing protein [Candidatus Thorarchaeota archaeon]|jgi:uncharacterized protein (TIGR00251 family)
MHKDAVWEAAEGVFLRVLVKPKSSAKEFIAEVSDEALVINLRSPAREGKANTELLKRLSKILGVSTGDMKLVSGQKSKEKIIFIESKTIVEVRTVLFEAADSNI